MTIIPINVRVEGVNSANGIKVGADATACVCVDDQNETLLYSAVQQLLDKSRDEIRRPDPADHGRQLPRRTQQDDATAGHRHGGERGNRQ